MVSEFCSEISFVFLFVFLLLHLEPSEQLSWTDITVNKLSQGCLGLS